VNGNLYAPDLDYEFVGERPELCLGTDYVLLRSEIRDRAAGEPPWREQPERAIVTMGGTDAANLTPTVLRGFDESHICVDAIVGPAFSSQQEQEIERVVSRMSADVRVARDPDNLPERMFRADFAVSTASTTTYELFALGTPVVSVQVVDNQRLIATALQDRNLATVLDHDTSTDRVRKAVETYVADTEFRRDRRDRGRALVDGQGIDRVTSALREVADA
jgi:spore coat polysaccharide biosynthesis predicted glycosyltransferase SpsG